MVDWSSRSSRPAAKRPAAKRPAASAPRSATLPALRYEIPPPAER
jgi:hypothetical protein